MKMTIFSTHGRSYGTLDSHLDCTWWNSVFDKLTFSYDENDDRKKFGLFKLVATPMLEQEEITDV